MATHEVLAEKQSLLGINAAYKEKNGFHDAAPNY